MITADRHPATLQLLRWFDYSHLPAHLQEVSRPLHGVAHYIAGDLPPGRELSLALTALQEALMWANAAVACEQPLGPERTEEGRTT